MTDDTRFDALIAQGLAASRDHDAPAALAFFTQASALLPASGMPHFLIGSEHASSGDMEAAERAFADAVLLAPDFRLARYQLGLLQFSSGRAGVALLTWEPLRALAEGDALGHFVRGFAALAHDGFGEALAHFRGGLAVVEGNAALAADIARVVEAVERLAGPPSPEPAAAAVDGHVLLAGYARGLH